MTAIDVIRNDERDDRPPEALLRGPRVDVTRVECECPQFCLLDHNN